MLCDVVLLKMYSNLNSKIAIAKGTLIRYNKLRKMKGEKKRHGLQNSGRMKLRHTILKGDSKPCLRRLYS